MDIQKKISLNSNTIKTIAIIAMLFDHIIAIFFPATSPEMYLFRMPGRIVAPIMCFFIAEGFFKTSNYKKYLGRLIIFALISHIPYILAFGYDILDTTSIFFTLAIGLICLKIIYSEKLHTVIQISILILLLILASFSDWGYTAVIWIIMFGLFHNKFKLQILSFILVSLFVFILPLIIENGFSINSMYFYICQLGVFLAIPFLVLYNGERGKKGKFINSLFYIFYPIHLLILYLINLLIL